MRSRVKHTLEWIDSHLPEWARCMIRSPEWRRSSALSAAVWVLGTFAVVKLTGILGFGPEVNAAVGIVLDLLMYVVSKLWIWPHRQVTCSQALCLWSTWSVSFFLINWGLAWLVMSGVGLGTFPSRLFLGAFGIGMNPVVFRVRNEGIFAWRLVMTIRPLSFTLSNVIPPVVLETAA